MTEVLDFVCWKWKPLRKYRSTYDGATVNVLRNMVARHYKKPHRFSCITDDATGIDPDIRVIPMQGTKLAAVPNPSNPNNPSCYRKLWEFSPEAKDVIGERFVSMDLDTVITDEITGVFDRPEDFVIWGGQALGPGRLGTYNWVNGSLRLLRAGTRTKVWTEFKPGISPYAAHKAGCRGSDQGWIAYCLGKENITTFGMDDGVHSFRNHIVPNKGRLLPNTRIVCFHGKHDPWHADVQVAYPWVKEHYK